MEKTANINCITSNYTNSRVYSTAGSFTAAPNTSNFNVLYDVIDGISTKVEKITIPMKKLMYPHSEMDREIVVVSNEDFKRFRDHVVSTEIVENSGLERLIKKFS
jgi:hypothetical protein